MVGQGVLRECLLDPYVRTVLSIGRSATGQQHQKVRELAHQNFLDFSTIDSELSGFDACFFCLGVTSVGMAEESYRRITYDFTIAAAQTLARLNSGMTFIYVSDERNPRKKSGIRKEIRKKSEEIRKKSRRNPGQPACLPVFQRRPLSSGHCSDSCLA